MSTGTETAVGRGAAFLAERQLPDGGFSLRYGPDPAAPGADRDDHTIFATALVAYALGFVEKAAPVLDGAVAHLRRHMEPGGMWRHWTPQAPQRHVVPADADDTAYASLVLRRAGVPLPDTRDLFLGNRDPDGRFYTWFVVRRGPVPRRAGLWRVGLRRARHPLRARALWRTTWAEVHDKDGIVNANVLAYLGDGPWAAPVVAHLVDVFRRGEEGRCDKWYRGAPTFQWAVARAYRAGVRGFEVIREESCARAVVSASALAGRDATPLDLALIVCALDDWGAEVPGDVVERLERAQAADGSWPAASFYYAGPEPGLPSWGSAELTTAFCLEALARCRAT